MDDSKQRLMIGNEKLQQVTEKNKVIKEIERDMIDLNEMNQELAKMVHDQGEKIGINNPLKSKEQIDF